LPVDLRLITADLVVLDIISIILALHLVANQSSGTQAETAADRRAYARMSDGAADYTAGRRAAERSDSRALLTRCQRTTGTAGDENCSRQQHECQRVCDLCPFHISHLFLLGHDFFLSSLISASAF
jgi:hypothetical protein